MIAYCDRLARRQMLRAGATGGPRWAVIGGHRTQCSAVIGPGAAPLTLRGVPSHDQEEVLRPVRQEEAAPEQEFSGENINQREWRCCVLFEGSAADIRDLVYLLLWPSDKVFIGPLRSDPEKHRENI